jgi:hypothetical protein
VTKFCFHVWGPAAIRHNEPWTLDKSNLNQRLEEISIQLGRDYFGYVCGDFAYVIQNYTGVSSVDTLESLGGIIEQLKTALNISFLVLQFCHVFVHKRLISNMPSIVRQKLKQSTTTCNAKHNR